jgi:hypothetical protein
MLKDTIIYSISLALFIGISGLAGKNVVLIIAWPGQLFTVLRQVP